jgi:hypothetical protein
MDLTWNYTQVKYKPRPLYLRKISVITIEEEAEWTPSVYLDVLEKKQLFYYRDQTQDRPVRNLKTCPETLIFFFWSDVSQQCYCHIDKTTEPSCNRIVMKYSHDEYWKMWENLLYITVTDVIWDQMCLTLAYRIKSHL